MVLVGLIVAAIFVIGFRGVDLLTDDESAVVLVVGFLLPLIGLFDSMVATRFILLTASGVELAAVLSVLPALVVVLEVDTCFGTSMRDFSVGVISFLVAGVDEEDDTSTGLVIVFELACCIVVLVIASSCLVGFLVLDSPTMLVELIVGSTIDELFIAATTSFVSIRFSDFASDCVLIFSI